MSAGYRPLWYSRLKSILDDGTSSVVISWYHSVGAVPAPKAHYMCLTLDGSSGTARLVLLQLIVGQAAEPAMSPFLLPQGSSVADHGQSL